MMHLLSATAPPVRFTGITKAFGTQHVLNGLDLTFRAGETTAIVGPNGAGKTTLLKCLLGLVHPDTGSIEVGGRPAAADGAYRHAIGYMPQHPHFPEGLTGNDMMALVESLRGTPSGTDVSLIRTLNLAADMAKPFRTLSGGTRQKVSALLALMFSPPVLVLDEPTAGLDPVSSTALKDHILARRAAGTTVLLTSHVMADLEELCDRVVFLLDGRIRFDGSLDELRSFTGKTRLERAIAVILESDAA